MRSLFPILILLIFGKSFSQTHALADLEFQKFIQNTYPATLDSNGNLIIAAAGSVPGVMNCQNKNITNLDGVQFFTNLSGINCSGNKLTTLPNLSAILGLRTFIADNNELTSLGFISENIGLFTLSVSGNNIVNLNDLSALVDLKNLFVHRNSITQVNALTSLIRIIKLDLSFNKLSQIPSLAGSPQLETFNCSNNAIEVMPAISSINLDSLICSNNKLQVFPSFSGNASLTYIDCSYNQISNYPVLSNLPSLSTLIASHNKLSSVLAYPGLNALKILNLSHNQLTELPHLGYMSLQELDVSYNSISTPLNYDGLLSIQFVNFSHNNLSILSSQPNFQIHQNYSYNYLTFQQIIGQDLAPGNSILFPQKTIPVESVLELKENENYSLNLNINEPVGVQYQWYLNGQFWQSTATSSIDLLNTNGSLYLVILNPSYPNDSLRTDEMKVFTNACASRKCDEFVLSPNGDGLGDSYYVNHFGKIEIINREGIVVKSGTEPFYWDGDEKGTGYFLLFVDGKRIAAITLIR